MTKDEALRLALEALERIDLWLKARYQIGLVGTELEAVAAIKAALEAKDEPVAWQYRDANDDGTWSAWTGCDKRLTESDWRKVRPLYTTPPQRKPLTDEEIDWKDMYEKQKRRSEMWVAKYEKDIGPLEKAGPQQEKNEFNPDWDTQAVLVEEIQRMAKRIEELEAQGEPVAGQPLPCPFCGHVGLNFADGETYRWGVASCGGCGASCGAIRREYPDLGEWHTEAIAEWNRRLPAPQRTWVGLTDEEIEQGCKESWVTEQAFQSAVWWAEAKLKEKNL